MPYSYLLVEVTDRVATVSINRPDKLNALNIATVTELGACFDELLHRDDVGAVVLTGTGRAFAAGADVGEISALTPVDAHAFAVRGQRVFRRFETSTKPTI